MFIPTQMLKACPVMAADSSEAGRIAIGTISCPGWTLPQPVFFTQTRGRFH